MMAFNMSDYEPVEVRLARFWEEHPRGRVETDLVFHGEGQFILRACLYREGEALPFATGYAEETVSNRGVNQTSALENGETSAIGRALANGGYAPKGKRPSQEEMSKVARVKALSDLQQTVRAALLAVFPEAEERKSFLEGQTARQLTGLHELTDAECHSIIKAVSTKEEK